MRIEICGIIASGKTTLASLFEDMSWSVILENFEENPFWVDFYADSQKYTFETEITFTLQHYHHIKSGIGYDTIAICDFSFVLDEAYAQMGLVGNKLRVFREVLEEVINECGLPNAIIHLKCDPDTALARIKQRGRSSEAKIDREFLVNLEDSLSMQINEMRSKVPIIKIDSTAIDFAYSDPGRQEAMAIVEGALRTL